MSKILITGGNSFVGKHLVKRLEPDNEVTTIPHQNLTDNLILEDYDYIFSLHSYGNLHSQTDRQETFKGNVTTNFNLLEALRNTDYKKFIYVSSSSVGLPIQTLYSTTKKMTEELTKLYPNTTIVKPYSITGVGEQKEHLIPTLIDAAFTGKTIDFVTEPTHDFIDVEDVVRRLISAMTLKKAPEFDAFGMMLVGSGIKYSNQEVLNIVQDVTGKQININPVESLRDYDTWNWVAPYSSATKTLVESITEQVNDYKQRA